MSHVSSLRAELSTSQNEWCKLILDSTGIDDNTPSGGNRLKRFNYNTTITIIDDIWRQFCLILVTGVDACQPNPCTQGGQCQVRYGGAQLNQNNGGNTGAGHYWYPGRTTPDPAEQSCKQSGAQVCCRCPNHVYTRDCSAMRKFIVCHFTACRRSLKKGNVFTHVSVSAIRSVHRGVS